MTESESMVQQAIRTGHAALCAARNGRTVVESSEEGLRALLGIVGQRETPEVLSLDWGDKLIGRAAGLLLLLVRPHSVFAGTMSMGALDLLKQAGVPCSCDLLVPTILNRTRSGPCPMEETVRDISDPRLALLLLQKKLPLCPVTPSRKENP